MSVRAGAEGMPKAQTTVNSPNILNSPQYYAFR